MNHDLTVGKSNKVLWRFALPMFASVVFQQLYNLADSLVAGKCIGESALAAVGNSYEITLIYLAFATGCNVGCSVVISQLFGARKLREMKSAIWTTWISCGVLCGVLMLLGFLFSRPLLLLIRTPASILPDSMVYLNIYTAGLLFMFLYNVSTGIFTALGDSRTPFLFLAISSVSNIALDFLFVRSFHWGISGIAWATFLCQGISCVLVLLFLLRRLHEIRTEGPIQRFSPLLLRKIVYVAVPSILQQSFVSLGNIVIQRLVNGYDVGVIAGYTAAVKLNNFAVTSFSTLGNAVSNFTAQNLGANQRERVPQGFRAALQMMLAIALPFTLIYLVFTRGAVSLFIDQPSEAALRSGMEFLRIVSPFYVVVAAKLIADGVLRGAGAMKYFMITTFTDLFLRVALAAVLSVFLESTGIWMSWPFGWLIAAGISLLFYGKGVWKKDRIGLTDTPKENT